MSLARLPWMSLVLSMFVAMLLVRRCPGCGEKARFVCERCLEAATPSGHVQLCGIDRTLSGFEYAGAVRFAVLAGKSAGRRDLLRWFANQMADQVQDCTDGQGHSFDVVTWVPATPSNRQERGFDQGKVLARAVAARLGLPASRLLTRRGRSQVGRDRAQRLEGIQLWSAKCSPDSVLVVDDIVTTGASLEAAAAVLRVAGAQHVSALTIASKGWPA